jgi:hypothetical protein
MCILYRSLFRIKMYIDTLRMLTQAQLYNGYTIRFNVFPNPTTETFNMNFK